MSIQQAWRNNLMSGGCELWLMAVSILFLPGFLEAIRVRFARYLELSLALFVSGFLAAIRLWFARFLFLTHFLSAF
jgi:hypothetical protein